MPVAAIVVLSLVLSSCGACPQCISVGIVFRVKDATARLRTDAAVSVNGATVDPVLTKECTGGVECTHQYFSAAEGSVKVRVVLTEHRTSEFEVFLGKRSDGCGVEPMEVEVPMVVAGAPASTPSTSKAGITSCGE